MIAFEKKICYLLTPGVPNRFFIRNRTEEYLIQKRVGRLAGYLMDCLKSNEVEGEFYMQRCQLCPS